MAIFELGCYDWDYYECWLFSHDDKRPDQFVFDCREAIRIVGNSFIEDQKYIVEVNKWLEAVIPELEKCGYEYIKPSKLCFHRENLRGREDYSEWEKLVGTEVYDKAIRHNFEAGFRIYDDADFWIIVGEEIYHKKECRHIQDNWDKSINEIYREWVTGGNAIKGYHPCPECLPDGVSE